MAVGEWLQLEFELPERLKSTTRTLSCTEAHHLIAYGKESFSLPNELNSRDSKSVNMLLPLFLKVF